MKPGCKCYTWDVAIKEYIHHHYEGHSYGMDDQWEPWNREWIGCPRCLTPAVKDTPDKPEGKDE